MPESVQIKRGTRAQVNAAAAASGLKAGEPYLITDENRIALGLSATTYEAYAKQSESGGSLTTTTVTLNVPYNTKRQAKINIVDAAATPSSAVMASFKPLPNPTENELEDYQGLQLLAEAKTGSIDFLISGNTGFAGPLRVAYTLG